MQKTKGSTSALVRGDQHHFKNGDRLGVEFFGNGREKALFFHGFPGSRHQGRLIESQCREFDLEVAAFDRPGYGLSEFAKRPKGYLGLAKVLDQACKDWGWDRVHLLSVSGGTPYALAMAASSKRVVSLHTVCGLGPLQDQEFRNHFSPKYLKMMQAAHATPEFALNTLLKTASSGESRFAGVDFGSYLMRSSMREAFRQGVGGAKLDLINYLGSKDIDWDSIRCPTRVWHGTSDSVVPSRFAEMIKEKVPHADLRLKRGETHYTLPYQHAREILLGLTEQSTRRLFSAEEFRSCEMDRWDSSPRPRK